jgi:hypothetical protein
MAEKPAEQLGLPPTPPTPQDTGVRWLYPRVVDVHSCRVEGKFGDHVTSLDASIAATSASGYCRIVLGDARAYALTSPEELPNSAGPVQTPGPAHF